MRELIDLLERAEGKTIQVTTNRDGLVVEISRELAYRDRLWHDLEAPIPFDGEVDLELARAICRTLRVYVL